MYMYVYMYIQCIYTNVGEYDGALTVFTRIFSEAKGKEGRCMRRHVFTTE